MASSPDGGPSSEINVTPLIDVLLVMLIIFMVIVPVMPRGLSAVPASRAHAETSRANDGPVMVKVERDEVAVRYFIDGASVEKAELRPRLEEKLARTSLRQILVRADAGLDFGVVAAVIDAGRAAGSSGVGLVTPGVERLMALKD